MYNSAVPDPFLNKQPDGQNVSADIQINSNYSPSFQTEKEQGVQMSIAMQQSAALQTSPMKQSVHSAQISPVA